VRWPDTHGPATAIPRFARIPSRLMAKAIKGGETEGRVEITLENVGAGHSVPSGWPGRQLALVLVLRNAAGDSLAGLQHEVTIGKSAGTFQGAGDPALIRRHHAQRRPYRRQVVITGGPLRTARIDDVAHVARGETRNRYGYRRPGRNGRLGSLFFDANAEHMPHRTLRVTPYRQQC
jgi:hypothetical protein